MEIKAYGLLKNSPFIVPGALNMFFGINRIKQELYKKGINREIIEEVMNSEFRVQNSETVAENQLERKLERWKNLKPMEFRKKAFDFLLRRGFEYEIVKNIVEKIMEKG